MALNINGTTGISGVDGSVSAPAVTGTDSNTGITFPSADTIKFSTGGVERMSITNSGVIGGGLFKNWNYTTDNTHVTLQNAGDIYTQLNTAITPSSTDSRIIIIVNLGLVSSDGAADVGYDILRDSTALEQGQGGTVNATAGAFMNAGAADGVSSTVILVDHPNTTSSITYKVASDANSGRDLIINRRGSDTSLGVSSRMFLIEIGNKS